MSEVAGENAYLLSSSGHFRDKYFCYSPAEQTVAHRGYVTLMTES